MVFAARKQNPLEKYPETQILQVLEDAITECLYVLAPQALKVDDLIQELLSQWPLFMDIYSDDDVAFAARALVAAKQLVCSNDMFSVAS